ncbi:DUF2254 domain-containing protein [Falsirhodobacter sp. 20TX0035]|uniref:DUF2254 domain-containing protein n=1 Tax=Falsirhodobacter sp. 20TX0035 TaxID=3022019 RepID=UPI00232B7326|nr:DUF2254 domain-containing protein [Falsirhodobacter sp. 20TX0035]MDB6453751.1 DUF2254 domain-containing protein [Falsirhodobacter sp. 20TX0035]
MARWHGDRWRRWLDDMLTSLWLLPALMTGTAPVLYALFSALDRRVTAAPTGPLRHITYVAAPDQARDLLATLLTSMITMASLVFSITMVVLTLAASQFGPRLIRNFMASFQTQILLGTYMLTSVYCLLLLTSFGDRPGTDPATASPSVSVAVALSVISLALLILYIHTLATSIVSESLISAVGKELDDGVASLTRGNADPFSMASPPDDWAENAAHVRLKTAGYVQVIEFHTLAAAARKAGVVIFLPFRTGDFAVPDADPIGVHPPDRVTPELERTLRGAVSLGVHRTPVQDLEYSIRHLVEIAMRALSPAINDPYTAVAVIQRLTASWSDLLGCNLPQGAIRDPDGAVRVVFPPVSFRSLLKASFSQIRQTAADKPFVLIHLLKALEQMSHSTVTLDQRTDLEDQVRAALEDAEREVANSQDLRDVQAQARRTLEVLARQPSARPRLSGDGSR